MKVIFDLDGTLYMTEKSILVAVKKTSARFGLSFRNVEDLTHMIGLPSEQFLQKVFGVQTTVETLEYFRICEREAVKNDGVCYEGIKELLSTLRAEGDWSNAVMRGRIGNAM
ncbi:HAD hydrolase-like protein [Lacrimispora defluvii]|uniref:HAD hydrolase-like protein n=1 Tax=Lacrimispora defluvii TaxID=2719233 RepID=A0ABX1VNK3_9FIRM|nr:HAD hydrolase-like protein [Lacrimispora defluvii]NNJ29921.1 HAD hydrolase-like protein [Lacrimispora defluvii]